MSPKYKPTNGVAEGLPSDVVAIISTASGVQRLLAEEIRTDGSLKPDAIRALLRMRRVSVKDLASEIGFHNSYLHQVIDGRCHDEEIRRRVAEAIGLEPEQVWGRR